MLIRPITKEEQLQSAQLFSIVFETPFDPNDLTPFARDPVIWAAFDEQSGEMASTLYVTDYRVRFDGGVCKMGGVGGVASLPQYRRAGGIRRFRSATVGRQAVAGAAHRLDRRGRGRGTTGAIDRCRGGGTCRATRDGG